MKHALQLMMGTIVLSAAWSQAQAFSFGPTLGSWTLPSGYTYEAIEAWVHPGETHGAPYVLGAPVGEIRQSGLFVAYETLGGMEFGAYMPAKSLLDHEMGSDTSATVIANDLKRMPDGSPLIIGASRSPRTTNLGFESTIWEISVSGGELQPIALGFVTPSPSSVLIGGNSVDGYAGGTTVSPGYIPPTGGGQTLPVPPPGDGAATDLDGNTIVGEANFRGFFFTRAQDGNWVPGTLQLPAWSFGIGTVSDVIGNIMGGYLYNPNIDDVVPVLWNTDGTLNKVFDLPGYNVTELIEDGGSVVALLNQGEGVNIFGESRLYAEDWADSRLIYGDILPALANGTTATVRDISSGGGLYLLSKLTSGGLDSHVVISIATSPFSAGDYDRNGTVDGNDYLEWQRQFGNSVTPWSAADGNGNGVIDAADYVLWRDNFGQMSVAAAAAVPEPAGAFTILFCAAIFGRSFRDVRAYGRLRQREGTAR